MSEILTESFCERCGTRYTFETHTPRAGRFGKLKVLSKGLKNYVLSDEASLDEALADARSDEDRQTSGQQLDAFHKTFNFCMSCRQYTCANCWNEVESRCLSCAPHLGHEVLEAPFRTPDPFGRIASIGTATAGNGHEIDLETLLKGATTEAPAEAPAGAAWPTSDLSPTLPAEETVADPETDAASRLESLFAIASQPDESVHDTVQPPPNEPTVGAGELPASVAKPAAETVTPSPSVARAETATPPPPVMPAAKAPIPPRPAKPSRDIALEVSVFEEGAAHAGADAAITVPEPTAAPPAASPQVAAKAQPTTPPGEADALEDRTAAAMTQTAELLTRFRTTTGLTPVKAAEHEAPPTVPPEPVIPAAAAEPETVAAEPLAAAARLPVAAEPARPQVDRVEVPTWHVEAPPAPAGRPNGHPPAPTIAPTAPGPALRPSVQARWPATPPEGAPPSPLPPAIDPAATVLPQIQPVTAEPVLPMASLPPAAEPQWPATPAWPDSQPSAAASWPASRPGGARVSAADAIWAASSRDVLNRADTGVQACVNCGLPLSATARFCRRCGANQVQA